jgi:hypothetical protein
VILIQRERYITILARNVSKNCSQMLNMRRRGGEKKKGMRKMKGL